MEKANQNEYSQPANTYVFSQDEIKSKIIPVLKSYNVSKAALFGSYARNEQTPSSDVDIIVDFPTNVGLAFFSLLEDLKSCLGLSVDLEYYPDLENESRDFFEKIKKDEVVIL